MMDIPKKEDNLLARLDFAFLTVIICTSYHIQSMADPDFDIFGGSDQVNPFFH